MTDKLSEAEKEAQLQKLLDELIPGLEEKLWKTELLSILRDIFEDASKVLEKRLDVELVKESVSLSKIAPHFSTMKPQEILALLSRVDRSRFDGGHVILVGVGLNYKDKNYPHYSSRGELIPRLLLWFETFNNGVVVIPKSTIRLSSLSDYEGLSDIRERLAVYIDQEIRRLKQHVTPSSSITLPSGMSSDKWDEITEMGRRHTEERESQIRYLTAMAVQKPQDRELYRQRLRGTGLSDDDIDSRIWQEERDRTDYREGDLDYRRYLDERYGPPREGDHASGADLG